VVGHLSIRDSIKGTLGGALYWGTRKLRFLRDMQMPCRRASLFLQGPCWGTWRGLFAGTFERKEK